MLKLEFRAAARVGLKSLLLLFVPLVVILSRFSIDEIFTFLTIRAYPILSSTAEFEIGPAFFTLFFGGIIVIVSSQLGFGAFQPEYRDRAFEYLFTFPMSRGRIILHKLLPRLTVILILLAAYEVLGFLLLIPIRPQHGPLFFLIDPVFFPAVAGYSLI